MNKKAVPPPDTAAEKGPVKATMNLRWAGAYACLPDADEPLDPLEQSDAIRRRDAVMVPLEEVIMSATACLGFSCPMPSHACDTCRHGEGNRVEEEEDRNMARLVVFGAFINSRPQEGVFLGRVLRETHYHDALHDLFYSAPPFRGVRMAAELRSRGRMNSL